MIAYSIGAYDILREEDLRDIDRQIQLSKEQGIENFAIGVYDEELCQALGLNKPLKSLEDRLNIMKYIRGVDFTFPVYTLDQKLIRERLKSAFEEFERSKEDKKEDKNKRYKLAYAPGTYDLFHAGHLENLLIASENSEKLIVGVKADELVQKHKNKTPVISEDERMDILRHFKFVSDVYVYYTRDLHIANDFIKSKYGQFVDAVFLGSDLKNDFKDSKDINIVYTERDEQLMKERSTTAYAKKFKALKLGNSDGKKYTGNARGNVIDVDTHEKDGVEIE